MREAFIAKLEAPLLDRTRNALTLSAGEHRDAEGTRTIWPELGRGKVWTHLNQQPIAVIQLP